MEIKMVTRKICEHTHVKVTTVYSFKFKCVTRNFHYNAFRITVNHFRK